MPGIARLAWLVACLAWTLSSCASAETRDEEQWGDTGGAQDTAQFEQQLREKHLLEKERLARIAQIAADRKRRAGGGGQPVAPAVPEAPVASGACPDGLATYTCRCLGDTPPDWLDRVDSEAWRDPGGFILAAARVEASSEPSIASGKAAARARAKILAFEQGAQANGQGFPDRQISGTLRGVETRDAFRAADGRVSVLVRYRPEGWKLDPAAFGVRCPELGKADYSCDCTQPVWSFLQAWVGDDGYVYAAGMAPATGQHTEERANGRARSNLVGLLQGMLMEAAPLAGSGGTIRSTTSGDINTRQTQFVASLPIEGGGLAVLIRYGLVR